MKKIAYTILQKKIVGFATQQKRLKATESEIVTYLPGNSAMVVHNKST